MKSIIEINNITKDYGKQRGVFSLSFNVNEGEILGFLGPNGAGKTTTIRQLMGFIKSDNGNVLVNGLDSFKKRDIIQKEVGYLPGEISFIDSMGMMEFIKFQSGMKNMKDLGRCNELMDMFDLNARGKIKKMSKGTKQKIGIVCAFMQDPSILILDEPTSGLDPLMQNRFVELIRSEQRRGKTILMSSHMFEEIEKTCDRAVIIKQGRKIVENNIDFLTSQKKRTMEIKFQSNEMAKSFIEQNKDGKLKDSTVSITVANNIDIIIKQISKFNIIDINIEKPGLEELFLDYYGGGKND